MKRFLSIIMALVLLLSFVACGDNAAEPADKPDQGVNEPVEEPTPEVAEPVEEVTEPTEEVTEPEPEPEPESEPEPKPEYVADLFTAVPVTAENFGRGQVSNELIETDNEALTWEEGNGVNIVGATLVSFKLPEGVVMGDTICVHIAGESVGNFRTWLIDDNEVTSSEQHNMETECKFFGGEFDEIIEYTVQYVDNDIADDTATQFAFKASSWNTTLDGLTVTALDVYKGTLEDYKADVDKYASMPKEFWVDYNADLFTAVPVTTESFGRGQVSNELIEADNEALTWADGEGVTIVGATLVSFKLPEGVVMGDTIVVHIKGESVGNFRAWLIDDDEHTSSRQINMLDYYKFMDGEFDYLVELTVEYVDNDINDDTATQFAFKASSWNTTLDGLTVTELGVFKGTLDDYNAAVAGVEAPAEAE